MRYGIMIDTEDVRTVVELATEAEAAGWDGVFISDAIGLGFPWFDPWVALAAIAMRTDRIRFGTMVTPVSRRRPWKLARESISIDHLSNGRLIVGVGLGAANDDGGFFKVGEELDLKVRAERLDEGLEILAGLWKAKPFSYRGRHYTIDEMTMLPAPLQSPRIPIWTVGVWQKEKSLRRVLRWDGVIPQKHKGIDRITPVEVESLRKYIEDRREEKTPFDIIIGGTTPAKNRKKATSKIRDFAEAGATWWLESPMTFSVEKLRTRIKNGPPPQAPPRS
jgi:hypothetical protein